MKNFDDLQSSWQEQEQPGPKKEGVKSIQDKVGNLRRSYVSTLLILTATLVGIAIFFYYFGVRLNGPIPTPVLLMTGALAIRIAAELFGKIELKKINPGQSAIAYRGRLRRFYSQRRWVHLLLTPLSLLAYCYGFILLIPFFKDEVSRGFYLYIIISGIVFLLLLSWIIIRQAREELSLLRSMEKEQQGEEHLKD
ncbi:hypothetical protein SAMN04490243_1100 [Robiginitalea myxolifaciens]|uniref:Uncharacterized protein n=1 Tax=Robiginitalea myxolifaciens TaxID=400055 RepID=A0A1I6G1V4_9FLAO|nr:hypothetical protein [Robiginitalea myxolifaciens]SFR36175.1 hypothetical protein SAMN04490243_1100 [Robiginitalea myxolifaciens]